MEETMQRLKTLTLCAALCLGLSAALMADGADDQITLKDGRVISGQVTEESQDTITMQVKGVSRRYKRDLVKKVAYGSGSAEAAAGAPAEAGQAEAAPAADADAAVAPVVAPRPTTPVGTLDDDICRRYQVPLTEVRWVRRQGISESDLPIVFFVAASAGITPGPVVSLRLGGWSWKEIERHYGLDPERVRFEPGPWVAYPFFIGAGWGYGGWGYGGGWGRGGYGYRGGYGRGGGGWRR